MNFDKIKKRLNNISQIIGQAVQFSKQVLLGAVIVTITTGAAVAGTKMVIKPNSPLKMSGIEFVNYFCLFSRYKLTNPVVSNFTLIVN